MSIGEVQADSLPSGQTPEILISGQLLSLLHRAPHPAVTLDCQLRPDAPIGDIIRISGVTGRSVYVVREQVSDEPPVWRACWPDWQPFSTPVWDIAGKTPN